MYFVAIKMGRRQGARSRASRITFYTPGTLGLEGSMKVVRDVTDDQRGRRTHFHRYPSGRSQLAVFLRCSLGPYDSDMGARSRLEKQPTDFRQNICYFGDRTLVELNASHRSGNCRTSRCYNRHR